MIAPLLLYLALLTGRAAAAARDFDWTLCDKESACFIGGGTSPLTSTKIKPTAPWDVALSIRPYNNAMKTLLARLLLKGAGVDYGKGASLSVGGTPKLGCVSKRGNATAESPMDYDLISSSSDGSHLYCEFIVRHSDAILPATLPNQVADVSYKDSGEDKTVQIAYHSFYDAIKDAVTCDPALIKFDSNLKGINETTRPVSTLRHATSCDRDPLWELVFESTRDSGRTEPASAIRCEESPPGEWSWKVTKRDGTSNPKVAEFRAHCETTTCLLCSKPVQCAARGCVNPTFRPGQKKSGGVSCAEISCPPDRLLAAAGKTAAHATCAQIKPHEYRWTIDGAPADRIECVERPKSVPTQSQPIIGDVMVVGISAGVLGLALIGIIIFCVVHRRRARRNSSHTKAQSTARIPEPMMHTGRTPDSDQDNNAVAATGLLTGAKTNSSDNLTAKRDEEHAKGETKKKSAESDGKGNAQGKRPASTRLKKKSSSSSKTSKKGKKSGKSGKSKTDVEGETEDTKKSKERLSKEDNETDKQSNERIPNGPIRKFEPDHTPYESLINYEGYALEGLKGKEDQKKGKSPKPEASKRKAKDTATKTENSAKDKSQDPSRPSDEDRPSLEPMRERTSKEDMSNNDDRTQSGTERKDRKK